MSSAGGRHLTGETRRKTAARECLWGGWEVNFGVMATAGHKASWGCCNQGQPSETSGWREEENQVCAPAAATTEPGE